MEENFIMPKPKGKKRPRKILWAKPVEEIKEILDKRLGCADKNGIYRKCKLPASDKRKLVQDLRKLFEKEKQEIFKEIEEALRVFVPKHTYTIISSDRWQALKSRCLKGAQ